MPKTYSAKGTAIRPYKLTDDELLAIGKLVRACAEIEDIIDLYLCKLAKIPEGMAVVLLGRLPASARLKLIEVLARAEGDGQLQLFQKAFDNDQYRTIVRCRNAVAHGRLSGLTDAGEIAFETPEIQGAEGIELFTTVVGIAPTTLAGAAKAAEAIIPQMTEAFGLQAMRQRRLGQGLGPHKKFRGKAKQRAKRERRPRPSRA